MPCNNDGYPPSREEILDEKVPMATLCAMLKALPEPALGGVLDRMDWAEAGVTRAEFLEWWRLHRKRDVRRKADEKEAAERAALVKRAEAKLTPAERKALKGSR